MFEREKKYDNFVYSTGSSLKKSRNLSERKVSYDTIQETVNLRVVLLLKTRTYLSLSHFNDDNQSRCDHHSWCPHNLYDGLAPNNLAQVFRTVSTKVSTKQFASDFQSS
jgi:hypothetical protein